MAEYKTQSATFEVTLPDDGSGKENTLKCTTNVHCWGDETKPAIVLLHGFMQSGKTWESVATKLASDYYVVAPDLIAHGKTTLSDPDEPLGYSLPMYVDLVEVVINLFCLNPCMLVGYSMGGRIASMYATSYPETISALVLESAGLGPANAQERATRSEKSAATVKKLNNMLFPDFVEYWESLPLFASQKSLPEIVQAKVRNERYFNDPEALAMCTEFAGQHRMANQRISLCAMDKPVLYLAGELDVAYTEVAQSLAKKAEDFGAQERVTIANIPGAGHNIHLENEDAFIAALQEFLLI